MLCGARAIEMTDQETLYAFDRLGEEAQRRRTRLIEDRTQGRWRPATAEEIAKLRSRVG